MAEMDEAVRKTHRTIAVLSPAYLRSAYCQAEWRNIFTNDVDGRDRRLVPVCIEKCSAKELGLLRTLVSIDLTSAPTTSRRVRHCWSASRAANRTVPRRSRERATRLRPTQTRLRTNPTGRWPLTGTKGRVHAG